MLDQFSFERFLQIKDSLVWQQMMTRKSGVGVMRHHTWGGYRVNNGTVSGTPSYYASVSVDDDTGTAGISLTVNTRFDKVFDPYRPRPGHKVIDNFVVGRQDDINDQLIAESMQQRYGLTILDFRNTPMTPQVGRGGWKVNKQLSENILARKTLYDKVDGMIAIVILRKLRFLRGPDRYEVCALAVPISDGLSKHPNSLRRKPSLLDVKDAMADWNRTVRELRSVGFTEEQVVPEWATKENWDFDLGMPMDESKKLNESFNKTVEEYTDLANSQPFASNFGDDDFSHIFEASCREVPKTAQTQGIKGFNGTIPDPSQLDQYVGTPGVDASQIRGIFSGVDEALSLVNQFDSSLLTDVAFIYNYTGGDAYGIYMSALDEEIKNSKLKSLLRMDGYQIQDGPGGGFQASHKDKNKEQIDREVAAYRQQIDQHGATTFGIDMNKVVAAAKQDAAESNPPITDQQDQYALGVMHLGATMVHEAIHSKGATQEPPSEQAESRFMQWVMPIINQRRQQRYISENRQQEYSPLVIDTNKRRMASTSNWLEKAQADGLVEHTAHTINLSWNRHTNTSHWRPKDRWCLEYHGRTKTIPLAVLEGDGPWTATDFKAYKGGAGGYGPAPGDNLPVVTWRVGGGGRDIVAQAVLADSTYLSRVIDVRVTFGCDDPGNPDEARTEYQSAGLPPVGGVAHTAQFGAQFTHNQQNFMKGQSPSPWSTAYWTYGSGAIEAMLDSARGVPGTPAAKISFEGQLRAKSKDKWTSSVDAGTITEELLEEGRDPLVAYKATESLMEDGREKPLMLPVHTNKKAAVKLAWAYDPGSSSPGYMQNLDLEMADRVQPYDENDEETTWFSQKFIKNQPRYNPENGNPLSKEDDIYAWFVEPRFGVEGWEDYMNERPSLRTSPWQRAAAAEGRELAFFESLLDSALRGITSGKIRGTRFLLPQLLVPLVRKFFENDLDVRINVFPGRHGQTGVWVSSCHIPESSIMCAEAHLVGNDDSDESRRVFDYITGMPNVRTEAISLMIAAVGDATRDAGGRVLVLGDLPLAVKTGAGWDRVRTVDFCSEDPDLCLKIGEITCEKLGAECVGRNAVGMMITRWKGVTFRFAGETDIQDEMNARTLTPLMLALDVVTEEIIDPTGEAMPDVEAKVVRTVASPDDAVAVNPLSIVDAVFLASEFGFSIESGFAEAAARAELSEPDAQSVWATIRAAGKGKSLAAAEEYGMRDALAKLMGAGASDAVSKEVCDADAN